MIFSNSPVKTVQEKVNPFSKKNKLSSLKFERKKDYKTFIKFIKDNTKELEQIKINDKEKKLKRGLATGGIVGGALLLSLFASGDDDGMREQGNKINNFNLVAEKAKADAKKDLKQAKESGKISGIGSGAKIAEATSVKVLSPLRSFIKKFIEARKKQRAIVKQPSNKIIKTERVKVGIGGGNRRLREQKDLPPGDNIPPELRKKIDAKFGEAQKIQEDFRNKKISEAEKNRRMEELIRRSTPGANENPESFVDQTKVKKRPVNISDANLKDLTDMVEGRITPEELDRRNAIRSGKKNELPPDLQAKLLGGAEGQDSNFTSEGAGSSTGIETPPSKKTSRFTRGLDKFTNFSDKIVNSRFARGLERVYRITTGEEFVEGAIKLIARNPKLFTTLGKKGAKSIPAIDVLLDLVFPKPLGPNDEEERRLIEISKKIQSNNIERNASQNPTTNNVTPPTDFPTPSSNIFIDPKQQLNIDDLFFLKSFSGG